MPTSSRKLARIKLRNAKLYTEGEKSAVNIDFGSYSFRGGFCGDDNPIGIRSIWGKDEKGKLQRRKLKIEFMNSMKPTAINRYNFRRR